MSRRQPRRPVERRARHQALDALVDVAEALFQAHHRLAIGGEAEMAGLDDAGMHRADRDLVQALALDREEIVRRLVAGRTGRGGERMAHAPVAMVEPGALVRQALRVESEQVADGALEPQRRRVMQADAGVGIVRTIEADDADARHRRIEQRHVDGVRLAPQAEQAPLAARQGCDRLVPGGNRDRGARPGTMQRLDGVAVDEIGEGHRAIPGFRRCGETVGLPRSRLRSFAPPSSS